MTDYPHTPPNPLDLPVEPAQRLSRALRQLERNRRRFLDEQLREFGIQGDMAMFLLAVSRYPGISQEALSGYLSMDKGNLARMAGKLADKALICRRKCPENRRQYEITLTESGKHAADQVHRALRRWQCEVLEGLSEEETALMLHLMRGMLAQSQALLSR